MRTERRTKLLREGAYAAEVDVRLEYTDEAWSPYLSVDDALLLDQVRKALREENPEEAARHARLFKLSPVTP